MSDKTNNVSTLPDLNRRILELVSEKANGNVSEFSRIIDQEQQKVDRLFKIDKRSQKYPKPSDNIIESIINKLNVSKGWLLLGVTDAKDSEEKKLDSFNSLSIEEKLNYLYEENKLILAKSKSLETKLIISQEINRVYLKAIIAQLGIDDDLDEELVELENKLKKISSN